MTLPSRRRVLKQATAVSLLATAPEALWPRLVRAAEMPIAKRRIPQTGELLPIVGIGTFVVFDFPASDSEKMAERKAVIQDLIAGGGSLIDTAAIYGQAEARVGDIVSALGVRNKLFVATKVWANDSRERQLQSLQNSLDKLKTDKVDLMAYHVITRPDFDWGLLDDFKAQGHCRYTGFTESREETYDTSEAILKSRKPQFFQIDYALDERKSEERLLPTAMDVGSAVMINRPFGHGAMFKRVKGVALPDFAAELGVTSWAQFFLKFALSHPAVTAVIPGTDRPEYMLDNLMAGRGAIPDEAMRQKMISYWESLPG